MTAPSPAPAQGPGPSAAAGLGGLAWRRLRADRVGMVSAVVVALFLLVVVASALGLAGDWAVERGVPYARPSLLPLGVPQDALAAVQGEAVGGARSDISAVDPLAPWYARWEARAARIRIAERPRSATLPLGGDKWGRDVLRKTVQGAETSILAGLAGALLAVLIGTVLGALSGYLGGRVGDALEWFYNVFTSIPYVLLILAFASVFRRGLDTVILVLGLSGWTGVYRLMRAEFVRQRVRDYVRAAEAMGASHRRRMFVHILPNTSHVILVQLSQNVVAFIKTEVILSFLGLGVPVDSVSWGTMLAEAQSELVIGRWWQLFSAGASMAILVTAFSLFTDALRDALDPRLQ